MDREIIGLSSMATRAILAELSERMRRTRGIAVRFESAGGVEIARRIHEGASADLVVLAQGALAGLADEGHLLAGTVRPLWVSEVVAAVPETRPVPSLTSESDLRAALLSAEAIACSTGPSGTALVELIDRLELREALHGRLVQAPPGVSCGTLLASGEADLAFQQRSELTGVPGVVVVGPLPGRTAISSTFGGAVAAGAAEPETAREVLALLGSGMGARAARAGGMEPVRTTA
ncbi:substrate-binding domain-containing protein [Streptomyces sp. NPDC097619]|uniref:substrate-binding domain-containing protein n=1 Tax=Streptomyces sp. NPDC097619 TaxID=3157228 RepID=UPI0033265BC8